MSADCRKILHSGMRPIRSVRRFPTFRATMALILREMTSSYGRSPGGYLWAVISPVATIALLSMIFSLAFRSPPMGHNFALFYATGILPFSTFTFVAGIVAASVNYSKALLAYPGVTFLDAILGRFILNLMTRLLSMAIVLAGILVVFDTHAVLKFDQIVMALCMMSALALGVGTFNCFLASMFPVYQTLWSILTRPLFILSCILFLFATVPQPYQDVLWFNPLVHVVGTMRLGFYPGYDAAYVSPAYVFGVSLVSGLTGLLFLRRYYRFILFN